MAAYKRILLCYDGSREGRRALRRGAELALDLKTDTHVLAAVNVSAGVAQTVGMMSHIACSAMEDTARSILAEGIDWLKERGLPNAQGHLAFGEPIVEIPRLARELDVDLVVVGHRHRSMLSRWWSGPGSEQLLDRLDCSILVVVSGTGDEPE